MKFKIIFLLLTAVSLSAFDIDDHSQALVAIVDDYQSTTGKMWLFEKHDNNFKQLDNPIDIVIGKTGLAWGHGLHGAALKEPHKIEGDNKTPAGIFKVGSSYGLKPYQEYFGFKMPYIHFTDDIQAVDDSNSQYYNQIVNIKETQPDWREEHNEHVSKVPEYLYGAIIEYNTEPAIAHLGSCIYMHVWESQTHPTAGCTAMQEKDLLKVLRWLDPKCDPIIVQLTIEDYNDLKKIWKLPNIFNN